MFDQLPHFFKSLEIVNDFIWGHIAFVLIVVLGTYFTIRSRFYQIRKFPEICKHFIDVRGHIADDSRGVHPLKTFYAAIGGCIGIGNVVGIATAVQIGGPGALFWTWVAGF